MLGVLDWGDPDVWLGMLKRAARSDADREQMQQLAGALMADYVFALKFDEVVFNPYPGGDAGSVTPIQYIMAEFHKDFPEQASVEDFRRDPGAGA